MSTPQSIPLTPRIRIGHGTTLTALGVLLAIVATISILALIGAHNAAVRNPVAPSPATGASVSQTRYLGPRQDRAEVSPHSGGFSATAGVGNPAAHYSWLGAVRRDLR